MSEPVRKSLWKLQEIAGLEQTPVVQDTYYTAFNESGGLRIHAVRVWQTNGELAAKEIIAKVSRDGLLPAGISIGAAPNGDKYYLFYDATHTFNLALNAVKDSVHAVKPGPALYYGTYSELSVADLECESYKLEVGIHSSPGTGQRVWTEVIWSRLEVK